MAEEHDTETPHDLPTTIVGLGVTRTGLSRLDAGDVDIKRPAEGAPVWVAPQAIAGQPAFDPENHPDVTAPPRDVIPLTESQRTDLADGWLVIYLPADERRLYVVCPPAITASDRSLPTVAAEAVEAATAGNGRAAERLRTDRVVAFRWRDFDGWEGSQ